MTYAFEASTLYPYYFNPHEREARDQSVEGLRADLLHFNPHEREALSLIHIYAAMSSYFNPHEREARDFADMHFCHFVGKF